MSVRYLGVYTYQVPRPSVLRRPGALLRCSCSVDGVVTAMMYARKVFDPEQLPRHHRLYSFLKTALSFADEDDLFRALAAELLRHAKFVPQVVIHESRQNISSTSYQVLSSATFGYLKVSHRAQVNWQSSFHAT